MTSAHAYLLECAARGDEADFEPAAWPDRHIEADWIRGMLLGNGPAELMSPPAAFGPRAVRIRCAHIVGTLDLRWCGSAHQPLPTLCFTGCTFEQPGDGYTNIDLSNAQLGGFELVDSRLTHLRGVAMKVDGSVDLSRLRPLERDGDGLCWCNLSRAGIGGDLLADDVQLRAPEPAHSEDRYDFFERNWAFNLVMSRIGGSVILRKRPVIDGGLILDFAHVEGDLVIESATIRPRGGGFALALARATIGGGLKIAPLPDEWVRCEGPVWMYRATIGGSFDLGRVRVDRSGEHDRKGVRVAVNAAGVTARAGVTLEDVICDGLIQIYGLQTDGDLRIISLEVSGAPLSEMPELRQPDRNDERIALDARSARVANTLRLRKNSFGGMVDLTDVHCATIDEDLAAGGGDTAIDGLRYEHVASDWFEKGRFDQWLPDDDRRYRPQCYAHLADVFARSGHDFHARQVLLRKAKLDARRKWCNNAPPGGATSDGRAVAVTFVERCARAFRRAVYGAFIFPYSRLFDFGLSPLKAVGTLCGSILLGIGMFWWMDYRGAMVVAQMPTSTYNAQAGGFVAVAGDASNPASVSCGSAIRLPVYATDVFVPLVDLREEGKCDIDAVPRSPAAGWEISAYRWLKAIYAILGWIVTTLAVLTFTGATRHRLSHD